MTHRHFDLALNAGLLIWVLTLVFTAWAGWLDWRTRKIPNWLTVPGFSAGLCIHGVLGGWRGALTSLEGTGLALLILLPMVLVRGLGAGDWKLMGAVGAMLGPLAFLVFLFVSALVAGALAVVTVIYTGQIRATARNMFVLVQGFFIFGWRGNPTLTIDNPGLLKLPFGVAAAMTTMICFVFSRLAR
jgi:Flp pilus assembly protein protease CpaA